MKASLLSEKISAGLEVARRIARAFVAIPYTAAEKKAIDLAGQRAGLDVIFANLQQTFALHHLHVPMQKDGGALTLHIGNLDNLRGASASAVQIVLPQSFSAQDPRTHKLVQMPVTFLNIADGDRRPFLDFFQAVGITRFKEFVTAECGEAYAGAQCYSWVGTADPKLFARHDKAWEAPGVGTREAVIFSPSRALVNAFAIDLQRYVGAVNVARLVEAAKFGPIQPSLRETYLRHTIRQTAGWKMGTGAHENLRGPDGRRMSSQLSVYDGGSRRPVSADEASAILREGALVVKSRTLRILDAVYPAIRVFDIERDPKPSERPWKDTVTATGRRFDGLHA